MQFFRPENFLYLWLVPAVLVFYIFSHKLWQKRVHRLVQDETLLSKLIEGHRKNEWLVRAIFMTLAVLCFVLALARPQWGDEKRTAQRKGADIIFMVDTSLSMLAEDIKPNRLEKAKFEIETFIRNLRGDRVGMVTFAGSGFLQTPLTLDHAAFLLFLDAVQVGFLPDPGTSLFQAVDLAIRAFPQKELKYKALILFTDGEDQEGGIEKAIEAAKQANVRIYCIGLGTSEGEPIPLKNEKGERSGFKKDRGGQMVLTRMNQPLLERLAKETGGIYLPATPGEKEVDVILKHLRGWGEQQFAEKMVVEREDQYQIFLILALIFLAAEMLVRRKNKNGNGKSQVLLVCLAAFFMFTGFLETSQDTVKKGNEHFQGKRYQSALDAYRKVQVKKPDAPEVLYDLGTALYKVDAFQESAQDLEAASKTAQDPLLKARAFYNHGNVQYRLGNFEEAIDSYKKALELDPTDKDAKYNLEFLQKQKNKMDKKDQEQKKQDQKKDEQKKDQKKDKQDQQQKQGQDQKDQKDQGQGKDQKDQDQQNQDQKDQDQQQQPQPQDQQDQNQQQQQQQQQKDQEQKEKEKKEEQQKKDQQSQQDQKDQQRKEQEEQQNAEEQKKSSQEDEGQQKRPLQGQMSMDNALNLLDAMKESEKELQDLRRPPVNKNPPPVEKDW
ncbi:MAG: VWA domain-containing protein [Candidatus Omnitrophota bacterium]